MLADHPDQRRQLVEDRSLVPNAIEEVLRFEPPSPVQARYVTSDVEHHGQVVPEGSAMLLLNGSGNRDDRKFPDGDRFDINRRIDHHLAFGYGLHFCLGAALARLEGRVALDEVLQRFPSWEVDWDNAVQARTSTVRGWETSALPAWSSRRARPATPCEPSWAHRVASAAASPSGSGQRGGDIALLARRHDRLVEAAGEAGPTTPWPSPATSPTMLVPGRHRRGRRRPGWDRRAGVRQRDRAARPHRRGRRRHLAERVRHQRDRRLGGHGRRPPPPHRVERHGRLPVVDQRVAHAPWPGLGAYAVSKAALDKLVEAWRAEHPQVGFTRVTVGECGGGEGPSMSEFPDRRGTGDLAAEVAPIWMARQYMSGALLDVEELIRVLDNVLRCGATASIPSVMITPRRPS